MASSSSSSTPKSYTYDVFLSFRGEDTRKNFVDHLYHALQQKSIHTFRDDERLEKGKRINDELLKAIEDSKFYIIVFSKNYASSSWCLDELVKIMECQKTTGQIAFPVFYDVDPSEVHKQRGAVGEAFPKHNKGEVGKWIEALEEAANLAGWDLRNTADGHEAEVIKLIVERLSLELRSINFSIDKNLIGMEIRIKDLESSLEIGKDEVRMIGIKGIGGGGKTTLARAIFDKLSILFEGKSFVENVREVSKASSSGLRSLQQQVLSDVLHEKSITISSVHDGKSMMKMRLCSIKVLVVLDDVDNLSQLEALAGAANWFKPGSRIIITTRDEQVLVAHGVKWIRDIYLLSNEEAIRLLVKWIHDVNLLSDEEAICLFSRYAFGKDIPIEGYKKLSQQVVGYAAGLPLTLKVLGSFLCGKDELDWADAVERLKRIPLKETLEKLELSYNGLEVDYKEIFLDVACFFKEWWKDYAIRVLESCGYHARNGLRVLEQRSLITISDRFLGMHDHIQEMGRNIVRRSHPDEPNRHSRLWIREEVEDILANDSGTEDIRAIAVELSSEMAMKGFGNMKKLRFLSVFQIPSFFGNIHHVGENFPNALRFLEWELYGQEYLPRTFLANNLVCLQMHHSRIIQLWEGGERKVLNKLRFLDLCFSELRILDLGVTPNLERLDLQHCNDLVEVHAPVGCGKRLVYLDLRSSWRLKSLSFIKELESLEYLHLSTSKHLEFPRHCNISFLTLFRLPYELPSSIGNLQKLVNLNLSCCRNFKSLPGSFCGLQRLRNLDLFDTSIEELPEDFGRLECLEKLNLSDTPIKHLPGSICMWKHLRKLNLSICKGLEKLPEDLGHLECLENMNLRETSIKCLPDSICILKHLRKLNLSFCEGLESLPEDLGHLECLEKLDLRWTSIKHLPDSICMLKHLRTLNLPFCKGLEKLPEDLGLLESLVELELSYCRKIKDIPDSICKLKHLRCLDLSGCNRLEKLPEELGHLESLEKLKVRDTSIRHLPQSISLLKGLEIIGLKTDTHEDEDDEDDNVEDVEDDDVNDDEDDMRMMMRQWIRMLTS